MKTIINEKIVFDDKLIIEEGLIAQTPDKNYKRLRLNRQDAACVLILNTETNCYVLTKQFRYAIAAKTNELILEIVAGKIDEGEAPLDAAIREAEEESGYLIEKSNITFLTSCFASPGYSSEMFFMYYATVNNACKKSEGGGLKEENEHIEIIEIPALEFNELLKNGMIKDAKTLLATMLMMNLKQP